MKQIYNWAAILAVGAAGVLVGSRLGSKAGDPHAMVGARKVLFYQDSMHPWIKSDQVGKCSVCGMDLTPVYEGQSGLAVGENLIVLTSNNVTVLNVQTDEVKARKVSRNLQVSGTLEADETRKTIVAAPAAGRIDDLTIRYLGVDVKEGDHLVTFYSPELSLEKRRFLVRARMSTQRDPTGGLAQNMSDSDPYYSDLISPMTGTVVERNVYKGQYVHDGERLFTIVDLSTLWFRFDVYEQQLPWLAVGQVIQVTVPAVPGRVFSAAITFIEPVLNEPTRSFKVRAELKNPLVEINGRRQRLLGMGVYAHGEIQCAFDAAMAVPNSAILYPGHTAYAYVSKGSAAFEQRRLKLGRKGDDLWEVIHGLEEGDLVVTSGNLLLDAQAQFRHTSESMEAEPVQEMPVEAAPMAVNPVTPMAEVEPEKPAESTMHAARPAQEPMEMVEVPPARMESAHGGAHAHGSARAENPAAMAEAAPMPAKEAPRVADHATPDSMGSTNTEKQAWRPRGPAQKAIPAGVGFRNNRLGASDAAFDSTFNRLAERRNSEFAELAAEQLAAPPKMEAATVANLHQLLAATDGLSRALAEDKLEAFNQGVPRISAAIHSLDPVLTTTHPWAPWIRDLAKAGQWPAATDLKAARTLFLPFSTAAANLARAVRKQDPAFADVKVYHCPMAPKPGLWIQTSGPLHNPFFGESMLTCGEEVKPDKNPVRSPMPPATGRTNAAVAPPKPGQLSALSRP
jgi:Cu(I)/Ag(I) efflux system membrane fusion protein